jgi:hypothetical protein
MSDYGEVGYDGPADPMNTECGPFLDWLTLCNDCYEADTALKFAVTAVSEPLFAEELDARHDAEDMYP